MNPSILTVAIFGSQVRGDADISSDVDILVITDSGKPDTSALTIFIKNQFNQNSDISIYSLSRLKEMYNQGHLFAWHLFGESKYIPYLDTKDLIEELGKPSPYKNAYEDITELIEVLHTIKIELKNGLNSVYEAGLLYVCLRNIALAASWYSKSGLKFGRRSPFQLSAEIPKLQLTVEEYELLAACRHSTTRGYIYPKINNTCVLNYLSEGQRWAVRIQNWIRSINYV